MSFVTVVRGLAIVAIGIALPVAAEAADTYGTSAPSAVISSQVTQQASSQASTLLAGRISQAVANVTGSIGGSIGGSGVGGSGGGMPTFSPTPGPRSEIVGGNAKAAGDPVGKTAFWVNAGNAWVANNQTGVNFAGTIQTGIMGVDHQFNDRVLAGLAVGYEHPDVVTKFNTGTFRGNNVALSPYAAYIINDMFSLSAVMGYTWVHYDTTRSQGTINGTIEGGRLFGNLNAAATTRIDDWSLASTLGYMYLLEKQDAYTENGSGGLSNPASQVRLGQWRWTNKAGYLVPLEWGGVMPYSSVRLEYDSSHTPLGVADAQGTPTANDRFGATFGLGVDATVGNDTSLNLEGASTEFREHVKVYSVNGTMRMKF